MRFVCYTIENKGNPPFPTPKAPIPAPSARGMPAFSLWGQGNGQGRAAPGPRGWGNHGVALGWAEGWAFMRRYQSPVEYRAEMFRLAKSLRLRQPLRRGGARGSTLRCQGGAS